MIEENIKKIVDQSKQIKKEIRQKVIGYMVAVLV